VVSIIHFYFLIIMEGIGEGRGGGGGLGEDRTTFLCGLALLLHAIWKPTGGRSEASKISR
jgi:hypothetical protein